MKGRFLNVAIDLYSKLAGATLDDDILQAQAAGQSIDRADAKKRLLHQWDLNTKDKGSVVMLYY